MTSTEGGVILSATEFESRTKKQEPSIGGSLVSAVHVRYMT